MRFRHETDRDGRPMAVPVGLFAGDYAIDVREISMDEIELTRSVVYSPDLVRVQGTPACNNRRRS